ncbi:unnamed protein product [Cylicocyclus nassatus]|uniref:Uncharacterized protein n=1 Tax=Cylicocyclus nassatus TaxID=53992 RepID=A0AA36DRY5_CYLNA|nr:unnamed protein product [Cylicocyclus nassatus]
MHTPVNKNTINYDAQYTNKKASQDLAKKPGLGWYWYYKHIDEVKDYTGFFVGTEDGSREINFPDYFYRLLSKTDEDFVERKKADKAIVGSLAFKRITESIQKPYSEYMRDKGT